MEVEDQQTQWSLSVHGHFKIGDISCRVVFDPSLFMCKTKFHVPPISMACLPYPCCISAAYVFILEIEVHWYEFVSIYCL